MYGMWILSNNLYKLMVLTFILSEKLLESINLIRVSDTYKIDLKFDVREFIIDEFHVIKLKVYK